MRTLIVDEALEQALQTVIAGFLPADVQPSIQSTDVASISQQILKTHLPGIEKYLDTHSSTKQ